jgi:LuxR family maltose regulon positive regulatory protein
MTTPLLTTKLHIPQPCPNLIPRRRLTERLDEALRLGHRLLLVCAPAGFGKTTLLSEWLHDSERPAAWLSLDEADNDPFQFWVYFFAALQSLRKDVGQAALSLFRASWPQLPPIELVLTALINEFDEDLPPTVLILDDYHWIEVPSIHNAFAFLLEHLPPNLHLVVATRADPAVPLARLRAHNQLIELRSPDLCFTLDEATTFLNQALGLDLSPKDVEALQTRTEGWIAGLQLAALALQGTLSRQKQDGVVDLIRVFGGSHRHVIDYLVEEVLQQQPNEVRDFLYQTAILDRLTAPLCDAVTGRDDSRAILTQLERDNLFLVPLDEKRKWYRYHRLFADSLRTLYDARLLVAPHRRAARWYQANGFTTEAVKHALATGDAHEAGQMVEMAAEETFKRGDLVSLLAWLDALPDELVRARHELALYKGWALFLAGQIAGAESYLVSAESSLPSATSVNRGRLAGLRTRLALARGDTANAIALVKETLDLIDDDDLALHSAILTDLGEAQRRAGDDAAAIHSLRQAYVLRQRMGDHPATMGALASLVSLLHDQGQRREAIALCHQALDQCVDAQGEPTPVAGIVHISLGRLYYEGNDLVLAGQHLRRGLDWLERHLPLLDHLLLGHLHLACVQHASGEHEAALQTIQKARWLAIECSTFTVLEADLRLKQGDLSAAARWAQETDLSLADPPQCLGKKHLTYVRLLLAQNRPTEAQTLLARLEPIARERKRHRHLITIYILQALTQQHLGHAEAALAHLEQAVRLAAPGGYLRAFLDEDRSILSLLPQVHQEAPRFVNRLLAASPPPAHPLVEPLSSREFEVLRLVAAGLRNREIAEQLVISVATVKRHITNIHGKLGVEHRTQAVARARELNLL